MPELPEVETITRQLNNKLVGKEISEVDILFNKSFIGDYHKIINKKIIKVIRRAKNIQICFENEINLLFHLKMTGQLMYINKELRLAGGHPSHDWHDKLPNKHTRIVFFLNDNTTLYFNDMRKFGWAMALDSKEISEYYKRYGIEPLDGIDINYLIDIAKKRPKMAIKKFLMDPKIITGIGNIYADESLFASKIHPLTPASRLNPDKWELLSDNIIKILEFAIMQGGTTDSDYIDSEGNAGGMQNYLKVYRKTDSPCPNKCGSNIQRIVVGGRGTHYCPTCQEQL
jgi:formamidopyrimidine-DNA glycosylase